MLKKERAFVIIEEPEAHLYPSLQSAIVEFIAYFANFNNSSVLITTHSQYILASVNTLYSAGKIIDQYPKCTKEVYGVIGSDCEVLPERVTAIKINKDKSILDLTNKTLRRLNIEMIDEVLDDVNNRHMNLYLLVMRECNEA